MSAANDTVFEEHLATDFVDELFKLCLSTSDKHLLQTVLDVVKENYLPEEEQRNIFKEMKVQFKVEQHIPTFGTMQLAFNSLTDKAKKRSNLTYLSNLKEAGEVSTDAVFSALENFVKQSHFIQLYDEVGELYNKGKKKQAYTKWVKGNEELAAFSLSSKRLTRLFGDFGRRNVERMANADSEANDHVPTGISRLDKVMHGGPVAGDLVCWLGDSKAGKSFALNQCGLTAARLGYPVLHVQAEDTEKKLTNRYDSAWMGISYYDIIDGEIPENRYKAYEKIIKAIGKGEIYIYAPEKFGAITVNEIRKQVLDLRKQGVDIRVLVVDYWDLINPDDQIYRPSEERFRQQRVGQMLKDLALELKVVIHTATQASSVETELLNDENFVITRQHLAEDKGKVRPVNHLITINVTREEKKRNEARLFVEASRDNDSGQIIRIKRNLAKSRFYDHAATLKMYDDMDETEVA